MGGRAQQTTIVNVTTLTKTSWPVAEAKARLSEVIERALTDGPQTITRHGRDAVVVVSKNEWDARTRRKGTLLEFLKSTHFGDPDLDLERRKDLPRDIDL